MYMYIYITYVVIILNCTLVFVYIYAHTRAHTQRGIHTHMQGHFEQAVSAYAEAVSISPTYIHTQIHAGAL